MTSGKPDEEKGPFQEQAGKLKCHVLSPLPWTHPHLPTVVHPVFFPKGFMAGITGQMLLFLAIKN